VTIAVPTVLDTGNPTDVHNRLRPSMKTPASPPRTSTEATRAADTAIFAEG
jgi:hypothetical protein